MKKILFSVVGIGLGHATRSLSIIQQLMKNKNIKLKVTTWGAAYAYYKKIGLPCEDMGGYDYKGDQYTFSVMLNVLDSFKDPTKLQRDYSKFKEIADKFKPDIVFTDTDPNAFYYAYRRNIPCHMLSNLPTTLDNYSKIPSKFKTRDLLVQYFMIARMINFIKKRVTSIFVPSFEPTIFYEDKIRHTDLIVRSLPSELPSEEELRKKLKLKDDFYYVTVGGSEIEKYIFNTFLKVLRRFPDKKFIISSNYKFKSKTTVGNMIIYPFISNALEYMKIARGIISPAGHSTISEAIVYKKPCAVIPLVNHVEQAVNATVLEQSGFGVSCFLDKAPDEKSVELFLKRFFENEEKIRKTLQKTGFKGTGAEKIAQTISKV